MERYCATSRSFCDGALSKAEGVKRKGSGMIERRFFFSKGEQIMEKGSRVRILVATHT